METNTMWSKHSAVNTQEAGRYCSQVPGIVESTWHTWTHLPLPTTPWDGYCFYSHFTGKATEAQVYKQGTCPHSQPHWPRSQWCSWQKGPSLTPNHCSNIFLLCSLPKSLLFPRKLLKGIKHQWTRDSVLGRSGFWWNTEPCFHNLDEMDILTKQPSTAEHRPE